MNSIKGLIASIVLMFNLVPASLAQDNVVVRDGDVEITYDEMRFLIAGWTPEMRLAAEADEGDRLELINVALANKKLAQAADRTIAENPEQRWPYEMGLRAYKRDFTLRLFRESIETPDFTELAKEQYLVKREKIAVNPEKRLTSHILFASPPGLPRDEVLAKAASVLAELREGADFVEMVKEYSDEPGAAEKEGLFDRWMTFGDRSVSPPYSDGAFSIEKIGEYSEPVQTQFGVHIIRLDGIEEKTYKPFEEVKGELIAKMESEYRSLAMKDYLSQYHMTDDVVIDNEAVEKILAPTAE